MAHRFNKKKMRKTIAQAAAIATRIAITPPAAAPAALLSISSMTEIVRAYSEVVSHYTEKLCMHTYCRKVGEVGTNPERLSLN